MRLVGNRRGFIFTNGRRKSQLKLSDDSDKFKVTLDMKLLTSNVQQIEDKLRYYFMPYNKSILFNEYIDYNQTTDSDGLNSSNSQVCYLLQFSLIKF